MITGSFKSKENADSQADMLREEGFSPEIISADNGFYRVCAIVCSNLNTAVTKKDSISEKISRNLGFKKKIKQVYFIKLRYLLYRQELP